MIPDRTALARPRPGAAAVFITVLGLGIAKSCYAQNEFCGRSPPPGFDQAPNHPHQGRYVNKVYGYSVTIPKGLTAYSNAAGPERGMGIVLSWMPRAYLSVDAAYDVFYDITAAGVHRSDLNAIRIHASVVHDEAAGLRFGRSIGGRYRTDVRCPGDPQLYRHDDVIVVRNREVYRLSLQSVPERYAADVKLLDAMLASWQWEALQ